VQCRKYHFDKESDFTKITAEVNGPSTEQHPWIFSERQAQTFLAVLFTSRVWLDMSAVAG
jgi:hypothetical protein